MPVMELGRSRQNQLPPRPCQISRSELTLPQRLRYQTETETGSHSIRSGTTHALKVVRIEALPMVLIAHRGEEAVTQIEASIKRLKKYRLGSIKDTQILPVARPWCIVQVIGRVSVMRFMGPRKGRMTHVTSYGQQ